MKPPREVIAVRSLTESDLGLFAAHRAAARSKQRAININAPVAQRILSASLFDGGGSDIDCICVFAEIRIHERRYFGKVHKNWRLGGKKLKGDAFASLDCKDFVLIRSVAGNDGTHPITMTFVCRKTDRVVHAGLAAIVERVLDKSMAVYEEGEPGFADLVRFCPIVPSEPGFTPKSPKLSRPTTSVRPMPHDGRPSPPPRQKTIHEKVRTPHILERMLQVAGDLSAPAQTGNTLDNTIAGNTGNNSDRSPRPD